MWSGSELLLLLAHNARITRDIGEERQLYELTVVSAITNETCASLAGVGCEFFDLVDLFCGDQQPEACDLIEQIVDRSLVYRAIEFSYEVIVDIFVGEHPARRRIALASVFQRAFRAHSSGFIEVST